MLYLAAAVLNCEYTSSNKEGLPCHCHDCGRLWKQCPHALYFVGATAPTAPSVPPPMYNDNSCLVNRGRLCLKSEFVAIQ